MFSEVAQASGPDASLGMFSGPGHTGETTSLGWHGKASGSPRRAGESGRAEGSLGIFALTAAPVNPVPDERKNMNGGWTMFTSDSCVTKFATYWGLVRDLLKL